MLQIASCWESKNQGFKGHLQLTGYSRNPHPEPPARWRCTAPVQSLLLSAGPRCWLRGNPRHFLSSCHPGNTHGISEYLQGTWIVSLFPPGKKSTASSRAGKWHSLQHLPFPAPLGQSPLCCVSTEHFQPSCIPIWFLKSSFVLCRLWLKGTKAEKCFYEVFRTHLLLQQSYMNYKTGLSWKHLPARVTLQ